jgi:1,4-dihydroxy-2-naphthoyl-CoA synthase
MLEIIVIEIQFINRKGESIMVKNLQLKDAQEGMKSFAEKRKPKFQDE